VRKLRSAAVALLIVLGITVAVASPAYANWEGCSYNMVCTYWTRDGSLPVYYYTGPTNGTCIEIGEPWDNDISSFWNRFLNHYVYYYPYHNCQGSRGYVEPNSKKGSLGLWEDTTSSIKIVPWPG
jgi:hypothetical protein